VQIINEIKINKKHMKKFNKNLIAAVVVSLVFGVAGPITALAATTPSLGTAATTFGVLGSTYTNTAATTISGNLGYTTGPGVPPTVSGATHVADATYNTAGTDQAAALGILNAETCNFNFSSATDLSLLPQPLTPGVYCITGAASIGTAGVTLSGGGTYVFRINGALTTVTGSVVAVTNGASACNVFWAPTAATTLAANTTFIGTDIDDSGITVGSTVNWTGRALTFGGTITTNADTIAVPTSCVAPANPATLHVIKLVIGGTAAPSSFTIHVKTGGTDVSGSPAPGTAAPGTSYSLNAGAYAVSENTNASYVQSFTGDCDTNGNVTLSAGQDAVCTVVNTAVAVPVVVPVQSTGGSTTNGGGRYVPNIGIIKVPAPLALPAGSGSVTYNYTVWNVGGQKPLDDIAVVDDKCSPVTYVSGDVNGNGKIDPHENWEYTCTTTLSTTTTNTAIVTGYSDDSFHQAAIATAVATVVVGAPTTPPLINIVKVPSQSTPFPYGGGVVTYAYTVTNPGTVPMQNITVTDNKCGPVKFVSGDVNDNNLLDPGEAWLYTCQTDITASTMNTATAEGSANGFTAIGYAFATVLVSTPGLPNTGFPPAENNVPWEIVALVSALALASVSLAAVLKKQRVN
jgi:uncharacterized repeat protein (TIGR01451 family)